MPVDTGCILNVHKTLTCKTCKTYITQWSEIKKTIPKHVIT